MARASGWLVRCERHVERLDADSVMHGYRRLPAGRRHLAAGDLEAAEAAALEAEAVGQRCQDRDLSVFARCFLGRVMIGQGRIERGLALFDECMLAASSGALAHHMTGLIYCMAISNCQRVCAFDRAREWNAVLEAWCDAQPQLVTFATSCLVHRAELLQLSGAWGEAIEEAQRAADRVLPTMAPQDAADALYQQGEVQRMRGDLCAAEELYRAASQRGREPQPGLALLRLAQGKCDAAASAIRRVMDAATDPLDRARLLPAYVEIMLAHGDVDDARVAAGELQTIADRFDTEVLGAMAEHARGAVLLAEENARGALALLRSAFHVWQKVGAPYIAARIRVQIGRACLLFGDEDGARLELDLAGEVFERLGATADRATAASVITLAKPTAMRGGKSGAPPHGLTARELEVLLLVASGKTNKVIAKELFLSEKTVDRHVSNIFAKINVASRAAATAYAYEHKLV
jgi:DNA-binding CsgD family transcriptional regulator